MRIPAFQLRALGKVCLPNEECQLCYGAAAGCFVLGTLGWIANHLSPGVTLLQGLLVVGTFYFCLGVFRTTKALLSGCWPAPSSPEACSIRPLQEDRDRESRTAA